MAIIKIPKTRTAGSDERRRPRDCAGLVAELSDGSPVARRWAARDLAECPDGTAALLERLKQ